MKINIQKFARVYLSRFLALVCAVMVLFVSVPSASASTESLTYSISLNNGAWQTHSPGSDSGFRFEYDGVLGPIPFNVRFSRTVGAGYDFIEWVIYTEVVTIDSISAYTSETEAPLPIEVSYLDGQPSTDINGDTGYPVRRLLSIVVDCTSLDWSTEDPYLRIYGTWLSDPGYEDSQNVTVWGCSGINVEDVVTPETTWLQKIWNAVTSGFSSVVDFLTNIYNSMVSGFDRVVELLDEFVNGTEEQQQQAGQMQDQVQNAGDDLQNAGNALDSLDRPELNLESFVPTELAGSMYLAYVRLIQYFWWDPTLLAMVSILAGMILLAYLLHGEKG